MNEDDIVWFATYDIGSDLMMALPAHKLGTAYKEFQAGNTRFAVLSPHDAAETNRRLVVPWERSVLHDKLADRWRVIEEQIDKAKADVEVG